MISKKRTLTIRIKIDQGKNLMITEIIEMIEAMTIEVMMIEAMTIEEVMTTEVIILMKRMIEVNTTIKILVVTKIIIIKEDQIEKAVNVMVTTMNMYM